MKTFLPCAALVFLAFVILAPPPAARADAVEPACTSCAYTSSEDCHGFAMITETCTTTYSNGTTSTTSHTYADPTQCLWCYIFYEQCAQ